MKLRVLGSAGAELPDFRPPAFLIDESLLLDAGTIGAVLSEDEQWNIRSIFITHSHLDHIRSIPALADNLIIKNQRHIVTVHSTSQVIDAMKAHLFNGIIWPDFTVLPTPQEPVLTFDIIEPGFSMDIDGYSIKPTEVNHTVPAVGYTVEKQGRKIVYTGDTGPTDQIWKEAEGADILIVEVSFPNSQEPLALLTKHLSCSLLTNELKKIKKLPEKILITHPKPQYYDLILAEIREMQIPQMELLRDGNTYTV